MTIHASKGLEAPIIILPDTTSMPNIQNNFLWEDGDFLWTNTNNSSNQAYSKFKENRQERDYQEYLRLLYVAMTRAEDHLIIAGYKIGAKNIDNSWYDIANKAMKGLEHEERDGVCYYGDLGKEVIGKAIISHPTKAIISHPALDVGSKDLEFFGSRTKSGMTANDTLLSRSLPPIKEDDTEVRYERSPLKERVDISYGIVLHKILEDAVSSNNPDKATGHPHLKFIPEPLQQSILRKVPRLFKVPEFVAILDFPDVRVEASMGYRDDEDNIRFGRMDLLAISDKEAVIIDYKTDKDPPKSSEDVSEKYKEQLNNYVNFIKRTHPNHKISAKILWFENLSLMDVV
jgi:ATP-dependent helicase/nuclease subunit A